MKLLSGSRFDGEELVMLGAKAVMSFRIAVLGTVTIGLLFACSDRRFDNPVDPDAKIPTFSVSGSFPAPCRNPTGICWDGERLWLADGDSGVLYEIDPADGDVIGNLSPAVDSAAGLAADQTQLWLVDESNELVCAFDPVSGRRNRCISPERTRAWGVEVLGMRLVVTEPDRNLLTELTKDTGAFVQQYPAPGALPMGLAYDGQSLWIVCRGDLVIYRTDPESGEVVAKGDTPGLDPRDITWDGRYLWHSDGAGKVYKLTPGPRAATDYHGPALNRSTTVPVRDQRHREFIDTLSRYPFQQLKLHLTVEPGIDSDPFERQRCGSMVGPFQ